MKIRASKQNRQRGPKRQLKRNSSKRTSSSRTSRARRPATRTPTRATQRGINTHGSLVKQPSPGINLRVLLIALGGLAALLLIIGIGVGMANQSDSSPSRQRTTGTPRPSTRKTSWRDEKAKPLAELDGMTMAEYMRKHGLDKNEMLKERQKRLNKHKKNRK